jgi:hypothetical protein
MTNQTGAGRFHRTLAKFDSTPGRPKPALAVYWTHGEYNQSPFASARWMPIVSSEMEKRMELLNIHESYSVLQNRRETSHCPKSCHTGLESLSQTSPENLNPSNPLGLVSTLTSFVFTIPSRLITRLSSTSLPVSSASEHEIWLCRRCLS